MTLVLKLPAWVGARRLFNISTPVFWQRAIWWRGRQWYVLRRRWGGVRELRLHFEWSREWGLSLQVTVRRWIVEVGWTGPLVLDMRGNVSHSVLGVARL